MICPDCKNDFPDRLLSEMAIGEAGKPLRYELKCPICALGHMNRMGGVIRTNFDGPRAQAMLVEAREILAKRAKRNKK